MKAFSSVAHLGRSLVAVTACGLSTAAVPQTSPIKFAVFGDIGNTAGSAAVANLTRSQAAQFILMVGDLCYDIPPLATQIGANYATEKAAGKLYPALGNHEYNDPCGGVNASNYFSYFTLPNNERYYDFVKGPVHFFALNSHLDPDGVKPNSKQGRWLKRKLAASTSPWQVVFFHHPPYSSGKHQSSTFMRWPFEAWGVDAVFNGHDHDYERVLQDADRNGVKLPYFVSGLGGQSRRSFGAIVAGSVKRYAEGDGALFVTASSTSLSFAFRNTAGALIDSYSVSKSGTAPSTTEFDFQTVPAE
jgi:hypothetical protein